MNRKKILILGSHSFSGSCLVEKLLKTNKFDLISIYNSKKKNLFVPFDQKHKRIILSKKIDLLKDIKALIKILKKTKPSYIVDFASNCNVNLSWIKTKEINEINYLNKINLIKAISEESYLKKYIYISTPEVFGSNNFSIKENSNNFNPSSPYATSKLAFELFLKNYNKSFNFPVIFSRFSNFYGPNQAIKRLIPQLIIKIIKKEKFILQGKGNFVRSYIYKDDFVSGIEKILEKGVSGSTYHFSGDDFYTTREVIKLACKLLNYSFLDLVIEGKERTSQDYCYKLDTKNTKKKLKWKNKINLKKGILKIYRYYTSNPQYLKI
tara:strand:- start:756 stop:1724 length:969 start_codon:yes stop_codon:yes gene_type:complete